MNPAAVARQVEAWQIVCPAAEERSVLKRMFLEHEDILTSFGFGIMDGLS